MHVRTCKNTDIHLPFVRADRSASRRRCRYDASSIFERNHFQNSGSLQTRQQLDRRRPDALCNFQGSVTTYIARKRVKRIWTMASKRRTERIRISRKGPFGACIDRRGGWRHVTFAARTGTFGCLFQENPNVTTFILLSRRFLSPATSHQLDGACS